MNRAKGFTLIEVMVAAIILFTTLSVFTTVLRTALISNDRALKSVELSTSVSLILDKIQQSLKTFHSQNNAKGNGVLSSVNYSWSATVDKLGGPPPAYVGQELVQGEHRIKIWNIRLEVKQDGSTKLFEYQEATW